MTELIDAETLKKFLVYNPDTGIFVWAATFNTNINKGYKAGTIRKPDGYVKIGLKGKTYFAHRLAYLYMLGDWPLQEVDHINGDTSDNRWINLRQCSKSENMCNTKTYNSNTTGIKGLSYITKSTAKRKWQGRIKIKGKTLSRSFFLREDAVSWLVETRERLHKEYSNHG